MDSLLGDLIAVLEHEYELYGLVLQLLDSEEAALLSRTPDLALDLARRKETVILRLQGLEESRQILTVRLARALGVRAAELTLRELAHRAEEPERSRLDHLREALRERVEAIRGAGDRNSRLCRNGLDIIGRLFHGAVRESAGAPYGPAHHAGAPASATALPTRVSVRT